jgi:hypothetical protein
MKVYFVIALLLLVISTYASPLETIGDCKSFCKGIRNEVLAEKDSCAAALKQSQGPNLFNACVEGRKKAFDQTCLPLCAKAKMSVTSFDGCQAIARNKGSNFVSWCRKGYDSVMQSLKASLLRHERELMEIVQDTKGEIYEVPDHETEEKLPEEVETFQNEEEVSQPDPVVEDKGESEMEVASENEVNNWTFEVEPVESETEPNEGEQIKTVIATENDDLGGGEQEDDAIDLENDFGDAIDEMISEF